MSNITYANKVAGAGGVTGQWRAVDANEVKTAVNSKADEQAAVTTHTGTSWDGTPKYRLLTSNLALTLSTTNRNVVFFVEQDGTGSRTLSINGDSIAISSGAGDKSIVVGVFNDVTSEFWWDVATIGATGGGGGDVTAPTRTSATIENSNPSQIVLTYNETLDSGSNPGTGAFNVNVDAIGASISSTSVTGTTVLINLSTPVTAGQTVDIGYSPTTNTIQDLAGNDAATFSGVSVTNNVVGMDSDAAAFVTAVEATDALSPTIEGALNTLVTSLKANGTSGGSKWTKLKAIYPLVGGTATAHKWNLKNPLDTDGAFRLSFTGTWTHNANGITGDGSTAHADTHFAPSVNHSANSASFGAYIKTNSAADVIDMGANDGGGGLLLYSKLAAGNFRTRCNGGDNPEAAAATSTGIYIAVRNSGPTSKTFKDGVATSANVNPEYRTAYTIYLGALNSAGSASARSNRNIAFVFIGDGLTDAEQADILAAIQAFNTTLGR